MMPVPSAVRIAAASHPTAQTRAASIARGDLRVCMAAQGDICRLVLVTEVHANEHAVFVLAHTAPEMATSFDAIVPASDSGAPYPVVVQTDLVGAADVGRLGVLVGHVNPASLGVRTRDGLVDGIYPVGVRLAGAWDRRWSFKAQEGVEHDRLVSIPHALRFAP